MWVSWRHEAMLERGNREAGTPCREWAGTGPGHLADHLAGVGYLSGQIPVPQPISTGTPLERARIMRHSIVPQHASSHAVVQDA